MKNLPMKIPQSLLFAFHSVMVLLQRLKVQMSLLD